MAEIRDRRHSSYRVLITTLWLTLLIFAIKVWAGISTQSVSLLADSLHTLIDVFSGVLSLSVLNTSHRFSGRFVWSHTKRQSVAALLLAALLGFGGLTLLLMALSQLFSALEGDATPFYVQINLSLIQVLFVVAAINFCLVLFERYEARKLQSMPLHINAAQYLQDGWLTLLMLAGLVGVWAGYEWLDSAVAVVLVLFSVLSYWRVLIWQLPLLLQQIAIAPEILTQLAYHVEGVVHCGQVRSRGIVGRQLFVEMHLTLHPDFMEAAYSIVEQIERLIRERYGPVDAVILVEDRPYYHKRPRWDHKKHR